MFRKSFWLCVAVIFVLAAQGCMVAESTYTKKVEETESLNRQIGALEQVNKELKGENQGLKANVDELTKQVAEQKQRVADLEMIKEQKVQEVSSEYNSMIDKMKAEIAQGQVTITELKGKLTVNMVEAVLFDSGKAEVKKEGLAVLQKVIDVLKEIKDKVIRVEGHTDNVPIAGGLARVYPTNWELSAARAINVTRFLQAQGIDPANLSTAAYGEFKPVADNETKEGRAKNRRIEIVLVPKD
ncbi:MAG: OmpA family protein [Deltaproteobacteria bacterium]|nr:OmpA family protein [Deltaproteobacteria bacterium]